jgi:hypothetical protein
MCDNNNPKDVLSMEKTVAGLQWKKARKRELSVSVAFCGEATVIDTLEGSVRCEPGDAILYGVHGEQWPVTRDLFEKLYEPVLPVSMGENGLYRRLSHEVDAAMLTMPCTIPLPDNRGDLGGNAGDWLVKQQDDRYGIVAEDIFAKTYDIID